MPGVVNEQVNTDWVLEMYFIGSKILPRLLSG